MRERGQLKLKHGGKSYFPAILEGDGKRAQIIFGYCDDRPTIEEFDASDLLL